MITHLPECFETWQIPRKCNICDALRAVIADAVQRVEALADPWPTSAPGTLQRSAVIAAIRGEQQ